MFHWLKQSYFLGSRVGKLVSALALPDQRGLGWNLRLGVTWDEINWRRKGRCIRDLWCIFGYFFCLACSFPFGFEKQTYAKNFVCLNNEISNVVQSFKMANKAQVNSFASQWVHTNLERFAQVNSGREERVFLTKTLVSSIFSSVSSSENSEALKVKKYQAINYLFNLTRQSLHDNHGMAGVARHSWGRVKFKCKLGQE